MAFLPTDRETEYLLPPSVQDWLPESHLARYVVDVVDALDLSELERAYAGRGSDAYHPATLLSLLIYGYATGVFSSRKIERATYDSLAFRFIAGNTHPDHDTLATFRRRFGPQFQAAFVQVLKMARANRLSRFGTVSLDGTKIHANASKHKAMSYGHAQKIEAQLQLQVEELRRMAERADQKPAPDGMDVPQEIKRREERLAAIAEAKIAIEREAQERYERERAEYEVKMAGRNAKRAAGKNPGGNKDPKEPEPGPRPSDQINFTDGQSRIMPTRGQGFEQCYNAQAVVDCETMLVLATSVIQAPVDVNQIEPMVRKLQQIEETIGRPDALLADTGYFSAANVRTCLEAGIEPLVASKREQHNQDWRERFEEPPALGEGATEVEAMKHRLKTKAGRARYALRKQTVEPVFGIIKSAMGFRQFLLRGREQVEQEWTLVCLAWNLKRMAALRPKSVPSW